jgi:uncharacterized membrane protein affecting hemolysin expression
MTTKVTGSILANTAVTAGRYGGATTVGTFTVDAQGRLIDSGNTTIAITSTNLDATGVTGTTYGGGSTSANFQLPIITVDTKGRITAASNVSITNTSIYANTGQLVANASTGVVQIGLADTAVTAGRYGGANTVGTFTVDAKGRLIDSSNVAIAITSSNLDATGVTGTTYGGGVSSSNFQLPVVTVDTKGRITAASNVTVTSTAIYANTGQLVANTATGVVQIGLATSGANPGSYGSGTTTPVFTVDALGRITSAANVSITQTAIYANTGQLVANTATGVVQIGLATSGANPGSYGSGTTTPVFTVDALGRITSVSSVLITGGSAGTGSTTYNRTTATATAGQTLFSSIPHTVGYLQVYVNGVLLTPNDYTANASNSAVVLTTAASVGDQFEAFAYTTTLANNLSPGTTGGSAGTVLYQSAANTTSNTIVGTSGYLLTSAGTGQPTWTNPASLNFSAANSQFYSIGVGTAASTTAGEIRATNNITAYYSSDKKFKENIQDIPNALEKVDAIGGKLFDWNDEYIQEHGGEDGYFVQKSDFGVIAQDVQSVFPIATRTRPDGSLAVDYEKLCALAFAAIKELKEEVEVLKGQIK